MTRTTRCTAVLTALLLGTLVAPLPTGVAAPRAASGAEVAGSDLSSWGIGQDRPAPDGAGWSAAPAAASSTAAVSAATPGVDVSGGVTLHGAGWGHSIGMSQYGAMEMAKDGYTAAQILGHYYTGTTYEQVTDTHVLRVNILHQVSSTTATSSALASGGGAFTVSNGSTSMTGSAGDSVSLKRSGSSVSASCSGCSGRTSVTGATMTLTWDTAAAADRTAMTIGGTRYRDGKTVVTPSTGSSSTIEVVNWVRVHDEYLDYLREVPWSWPGASLQAQAAAARGYALRKYLAGVQSSCACHLYDTTRDQVYGGYPSSGEKPYWSGWQNAVNATRSTTKGYVARYDGSMIQAFYSSSSGGRTENNEDVWGGTALPYLRGVSDPWSLRSSNPYSSWTVTYSASTLASAFGLSNASTLDLTDRTVNGGVHTATLYSSSGASKTLTGEQLRAKLGLRSIHLGRQTQRLSGTNRYATAAAVARGVNPSASDVVLAAGDSTLVDAAVSGPLAATLDAPMLLTARDALPTDTVKELDRRKSSLRTVWVVGGSTVVGADVVAALEARGLAVERLSGANRSETSEAVAAEIASRRSTPAVVVAGRDGLVDALGVSGAAAALGEPILYTSEDGLDDASRRAVGATGATSARVVGSTSRVGGDVVTELKGMGLSVTRLAGSSRYATSRAVATFYRGKVPSTTELVITSGKQASLVDSLVAGQRRQLIALTYGTSLGSDAAATIRGLSALRVVTAIGGTTSVSNSTLAAASVA